MYLLEEEDKVNSKKVTFIVILIVLLITSISTFFLYRSGEEDEFIISDSLLEYAPQDGQAPETISLMNIKYTDENENTSKEIQLEKKIDSIGINEIIDGLSGIELKILDKENLDLLNEETIIEIRPSSGVRFDNMYSYIADRILIYSTGDIVFVGPKPVGEIVPKSPLYTNVEGISHRIESIRNSIEKAYNLKNP